MKFDVLTEPLLKFGYDQALDDPRHGLFLFGPLKDQRKPTTMRVGVVGTPEGIALYRGWVERVNQFIPAARPDAEHQVGYPGFQAAFQTSWPSRPVVELAVSPHDIAQALRLSDRHLAIYETVSIFEGAIRNILRSDDVQVDLWFVVIPEEVHTYGRPLSRVPSGERVLVRRGINARIARHLKTQPSLFEEDASAATVYDYDVNFHHQLKARLLDARVVVQIVRDSSLQSMVGAPTKRRLQDAATIAWNLTTTSFFKAGGRPWKLNHVRDRVCYIGLVFKRMDGDPTGRSACCGAQMFLDSGDGLVFKGAVGQFFSPATKEFHLSRETARDLMQSVMNEYRLLVGDWPAEAFIHARTRFDDEEWAGFNDGVPSSVRIVGVRIARSNDVKAYRRATTPVLRGSTLTLGERRGFLWSSGYVPALRTYPGREVPNPISIEVLRGEAPLRQVLEDVLALTKVNFNSCLYGDGIPVTLRFADAVGEILTAGPTEQLPPLPFRHYI